MFSARHTPFRRGRGCIPFGRFELEYFGALSTGTQGHPSASGGSPGPSGPPSSACSAFGSACRGRSCPGRAGWGGAVPGGRKEHKTDGVRHTVRGRGPAPDADWTATNGGWRVMEGRWAVGMAGPKAPLKQIARPLKDAVYPLGKPWIPHDARESADVVGVQYLACTLRSLLLPYHTSACVGQERKHIHLDARRRRMTVRRLTDFHIQAAPRQSTHLPVH